jgi:hypothetical protein
MMQTVLEPALELSGIFSNSLAFTNRLDTEYNSFCQCLGHASTLLYTSTTSISAGSSTYYFVRVPNIFAKTGLWLGALESHIYTLRIRTQTTGALDSGTGILALSDIQLILETVLIPESEFPEMRRDWSQKAWIASQAQLNEPNQVTLTATGESPRIGLPQFKDLPVTAIFSFIHQSRAIAASAYFNWQGLQNSSKVHIIDRNGSQLFTSNSEYYGFQRYYKSARQLADSKLFQVRKITLQN